MSLFGGKKDATPGRNKDGTFKKRSRLGLLTNKIKEDVKERLSLHALWGYGTENSRLGQSIEKGAADTWRHLTAKPKQKGEAKDKPEAGKKEEAVKEEQPKQSTQEAQPAPSATVDGNTARQISDDRIHQKLVDIDDGITRLDSHITGGLNKTASIIRETANTNQPDAKPSSTDKAKIERFQRESVKTAADKQIDTIRQVSNPKPLVVKSDEEQVKQRRQMEKVATILEKILAEQQKDKTEQKADERKEGRGRRFIREMTQGRGTLRDRARRFARRERRLGRVRMGRSIQGMQRAVQRANSRTRAAGRLASRVSRQYAARAASLASTGLRTSGTALRTVGARALPLLASGAGALKAGATGLGSKAVGLGRGALGMGARALPMLGTMGSNAVGAIGSLGAAPIAAGTAALVFGGTGLYAAYKAARGEDASNWISNLTDKGVQAITGDKDASLGTKIYDWLHPEEAKGLNPAPTIKQDAQRKLDDAIKQTATIPTLDGKPAISPTLQREMTVEPTIQPEATQAPQESMKPAPVSTMSAEPAANPMTPTLTESAKQETATEKAVQQQQANPKPVIVPAPTTAPQKQIEGGSGHNGGKGEQPAIATRAVDSTLRRLGESFIFATV